MNRAGRQRVFSIMSPLRVLIAFAGGLMVPACAPKHDAASDQLRERNENSARRPPVGTLPRTGLAVGDSATDWCAEFVADSTAPAMEPGRQVTLVFPGPAPVASWSARVAGPHEGECPAGFPQPRWGDYVAYRLELVRPLPAAPTDIPSVALLVASDVAWSRGADGLVRADLDGDGVPEEARRCLADEGEHLTIWSMGPANRPVRRWHEYFDWGAFTKPSCRPGEDGMGG